MRPPVRPPRLRCGLFPSIYLPHLLVLPATFGLRCFLPSYPYFPALYVVSVRQVRGLPTASFRFHLTVNTLAVQLCASSLPTRTRDFHPLEPAHGGRTKKSLTSSTKVPLARLNIPSVFLSRQRDEGATTDDGMKSPLRASCSDKRRTGFPASLSVARPSYTFLMRAVVLPQLSGKSRKPARNIRW